MTVNDAISELEDLFGTFDEDTLDAVTRALQELRYAGYEEGFDDGLSQSDSDRY